MNFSFHAFYGILECGNRLDFFSFKFNLNVKEFYY
jgi:hypothetical protein